MIQHERLTASSAAKLAPTAASPFRWLLSSLRPYRWALLGVALAVAAHSGLNLALPVVIRRLVTGLSLSELGARMTEINLAIQLLAFIFAAQAVLSFAESALSQWAGERYLLNLQSGLFRHLLRMPLSFFTRNRTGELTARMVDDAKGLRAVVTDSTANLVRHGLVVVVVIGLLFVLSAKLTAIALVFILLIALGGTAIMKSIEAQSTTVQDRQAQAAGLAQEMLQNMPVIKSFVRESYVDQRLHVVLKDSVDLRLKRNLLQSAVLPVTNLLAFGAVGVLVWLASREVATGAMAGPDLLAYLIYAAMLAGSLSRVADHLGKVREGVGAASRLIGLLAEAPETEVESGHPAQVEGRIELDGISFTYEGSDRPAIQNMSAKIAPGTTIALVGPSGAGKSTLVNLLLRSYDPQEGSIRLDGRDIRSLPRRWLREQIGLVPQETFIFSGTIRENILFGLPEASHDAFLVAALAANVHEFAERLPNGYDTVVGERGATLSRGQCQRIAIARMLLKNPRVVILDEATASLDGENEELIQEALHRLTAGRTTIVIAHRASTIREADHILVLVSGQVLEEGTHAVLAERGGLYSRLFLQ